MSHRNAKAMRAAARAEAREHSGGGAPPVAAGSDAIRLGYGWGNGHQGADWSRTRGYVYFPELDTRREITSYTRSELLRKGRFLYANHGIAKRIINGLARMVAGTGLIPEAATRDRLWNREAEKIFAQDTGSPFAFDVGGRYNFYSSQQALLRFRFRDGDSAAALATSATGRGRLGFYEGHQIGNTSTIAAGFDQEQWRDGVRTDANNAALGYRFPQDDGTFKDIDAADLIFFCDYERAGQSRGLTILSHAVNNLVDVAEITSYIKQGVKLSNQFGYWFEKDAAAAPSSGGAGSAVAGSKSKISTAAGDVTMEKIYGGGQIPDLLPGWKLKFNGTSHPHPNNLTLMEFLIRDIAWGVGMSPELLWNIAALGGANTRFVMADAQGWIEEQQAQLVRLYCQRVWVYFISKAIKTGRLRPSPDPEWWKVNWVTPSRLTVDFGRDGKLHLEQLKMGLLTYSRALGWQGQEFEPHMDKLLDEVAYFKAGLNAANAAAYRPGVDRNLSWQDWQMWRNAAGNVAGAATDLNSGPIADDTLAEPGQASAFLASLAKNPAAAEKFMEHLRTLPEAA